MKSAHYFFSNPAHGKTERQTDSTDHITSLAEVTGGLRHSKPRPALYCRVLPPGTLDSMIPEPLAVCFQSFMTTA